MRDRDPSLHLPALATPSGRFRLTALSDARPERASALTGVASGDRPHSLAAYRHTLRREPRGNA